MKLQEPLLLREAAEFIGARFAGDPEARITGVNEIHKVETGDLTFVDFEKYYKMALGSAASFIIINKDVEPPAGKALIYSDDPFRDFNRLTLRFRPVLGLTEPISPSAVIDPSATLQPGVVVAHGVRIGAHCFIHSNVVLYDHTEIGENVVIHANTTIGGDAFYYKRRPGKRYDKLHSCGSVRIERNVEIGAGCTIDRGVSGVTVIGEGTKIDNLVHVGHGTVIGKNCLIAAQAGIAGKVRIGDGAVIWGQVGISKDLTIGENAEIYPQSGVPHSLPGDKVYFGSPAQEARQYIKQLSVLKRIPEFWDKIKKLP